MSKRWTIPVAVVVLLAVLAAGGLWLLRPGFTEERLREVVLTTIQEEAPASFYVTGTLSLATTASARSTKVLLPGMLDLPLGSTEATVRVPGRVSYGFDLRQLRAADIRFAEDGRIEVRLPRLSVFSVEAELEKMEVRTSTGWVHLSSGIPRQTEHEALGAVRPAMRRQAERHLDTSRQPALHTAAALGTLLTPVLEAAGVRDPRFRFRIGPELVMEPG